MITLFWIPIIPLPDHLCQSRERLTCDAIFEWINKEGYLTLRGKQFRGGHVHSIFEKSLANEELLNREPPPVWTDVIKEVVDKTILLSNFWGFK